MFSNKESFQFNAGSVSNTCQSRLILFAIKKMIRWNKIHPTEKTGKVEVVCNGLYFSLVLKNCRCGKETGDYKNYS